MCSERTERRSLGGPATDMSPRPSVRPFSTLAECEEMVDYYLGLGAEGQLAMGIDPERLPERDAWVATVRADLDKEDAERERYYVAWLLDDERVGHSSLSHIEVGVKGHCHLHLWRPELRRAGVGPLLLARSIDLYFERFDLATVVCEPRAENPAPNRALPKLGFRLVKRYRTTPTSMAYEQDIHRWEVTREEWLDRRASGP